MITFCVGLVLSELLRNPLITPPHVPLTCLTATKAAETALWRLWFLPRQEENYPRLNGALKETEVSGGHQVIYRLLSDCCQHSPATQQALRNYGFTGNEEITYTSTLT